MELMGTWQSRGKTWRGNHPWWYELFEKVLVATPESARGYAYAEAAFVSQCKGLDGLHPHAGELFVLDVTRLEPAPDDENRCLAFGVTAARRVQGSDPGNGLEQYRELCRYFFALPLEPNPYIRSR